MQNTSQIEAECTECRWKFFRHQADELTGLSGEDMDSIIDRQGTQHELATGHRVNLNAPAER